MFRSLLSTCDKSPLDIFNFIKPMNNFLRTMVLIFIVLWFSTSLPDRVCQSSPLVGGRTFASRQSHTLLEGGRRFEAVISTVRVGDAAEPKVQ